LVSNVLVISIPSWVGLVEIRPAINSIFSHKRAESSSVIFDNSCHIADQDSIRRPTFRRVKQIKLFSKRNQFQNAY
jgi:hypothetical protein